MENSFKEGITLRRLVEEIPMKTDKNEDRVIDEDKTKLNNIPHKIFLDNNISLDKNIFIGKVAFIFNSDYTTILSKSLKRIEVCTL